jgi:hypothetical protein
LKGLIASASKCPTPIASRRWSSAGRAADFYSPWTKAPHPPGPHVRRGEVRRLQAVRRHFPRGLDGATADLGKEDCL